MPIPKPSENQSKEDYMKSCVSFVLEEGSATTQDQAVAICEQTYEASKKRDEDDKSFNQIWEKRQEGETPKFITQAEIKSANGTIKAILTKEIVDRDGEVVSIDGIDLTNYKNNPVLIDAHQSNGSIVETILGRVNNLKKATGEDGTKELVGELEFAPSPNGQIARAMVESGFAKTLSIGFGVKDYDAKSRSITKSELYETSLVIVPANVGASVMKGFNPEKQNEADEMIKRLKNYNDIHPKIKEYRRFFLSEDFTKMLGYTKTGDELVDIKSIYELVVKELEQPQETPEAPIEETPEQPEVDKEVIKNEIVNAFVSAYSKY